MCSILAYNGPVENLDEVNYFLRRRGPDATEISERRGWTFVHNLLSITGAFTKQPFVSSDGNIICLFNGEIYNWKDQGIDADSDGKVLLPLYEKYGTSFVKKLDGEFAIALFDFNKGTLLLSSDVFATKPLWFAKEGGRFGIASYRSALVRLGFHTPQKVEANTTVSFSIKDFSIVQTNTVFDFDPSHQDKTSVDDFLTTFARAIEKRAGGQRERVFIGLSGGYDSGAIACELKAQKLLFRAYSILGREDKAVLLRRHKRLPEGSGELFDASHRDYQKEKDELKDVCESFKASLHPRFPEREILEDAGAIGLGIICKKARAEGYKIYLSGQGADEILSDYRMHGKGMTGHSSLDGKFPDDLGAQFPWHNFYGGAQRFYIAKEEHVAGAYGIEARYPFLDAALVQEFLYLSPEIKNAGYKYPLQVLFEKNQYPFAKEKKVGFVPRQKTFSDYIARIIFGKL